MERKSARHNPKNRATAVIWSAAVGLFALCIPLTAVAKSGALLPILVMLGASISTTAVWVSPKQRRSTETLMIKALEDRIMNLETIYTSLPEFERIPQFLDKDSSTFSKLTKDKTQELTGGN
ncbi:MAG: hypothetical protein AAFX01_04195 [Cyanobacteria bacterium J06638_28]